VLNITENTAGQFVYIYLAGRFFTFCYLSCIQTDRRSDVWRSLRLALDKGRSHCLAGCFACFRVLPWPG
jgi:hypothetical protein